MKILFVQYGDYAEAYRRLKSGAPETYRDQKKSVDHVEELAQHHDVALLVIRDTPYDETLRKGLRSFAVPYAKLDRSSVKSILDLEKPDVAILITPHLRFLAELRARNIPTLPCLADIFTPTGLKSRLHNLALRWVLRSRVFPCVANHNLNASRSVEKDLGYPPNRIVPWDWSAVQPEPTGKPGLLNSDEPTAFFAGALLVDKGVQDCLEAVALVNAQGLNLSMSFAGPGDVSHWMAEAARLGVTAKVRFLGTVPNSEVRKLMRAHDMVIVPSRPGYAEGLPNTIYEALASRSPLIVSDHPAFRGRLKVGSQCLEFEAALPSALAKSMTRLCRDRALYASLSDNAVAALRQIHVGIERHMLIDQFLEDPRNTTGWVAKYALSAV